MLFKQVAGMTSNQDVTMARIGKAKDFLHSGEMNVSETAAHTGYRDLFHFSRQFKALRPPVASADVQSRGAVHLNVCLPVILPP